MEHETLEVRRLGNVHRRARCLQEFATAADTISAAPEKLVEHVVLVGGNDQPADRKPHPSGDVTGEHVAEIARWNGEGNLLIVISRCRKVALEVIHDLRRDARPIDGIDGAEVKPPLERRVGGYRLDDVLAVVEYAVDGDGGDICGGK